MIPLKGVVMEDFSLKLGKRIKELRARVGLSQDQLAEQAGISGKYLGEIERGEVNVSAVILAKLAVVLQLSLPELLSFEHHASREKLREEMNRMLDDADDEAVRLSYRILSSIVK